MAQSAKQPQKSEGFGSSLATGVLRVAVAILIPLLAIVLLVWSVTFMTDRDAPKALTALVAIIVGVGGTYRH